MSKDRDPYFDMTEDPEVLTYPAVDHEPLQLGGVGDDASAAADRQVTTPGDVHVAPQMPAPIDGTLRQFALRVPSVIDECSGIMVFGKRIKSLVFSTDLCIIRNVNADAVFGLFTADPMVHELGRQVLLVEIFLGIGRALNIVMVKALIAVGDVKTPVTVNVISSWIFAVAGGYALGIGLGWGIVGMWVAMCVDEWLRAGFLLVTFARGGWRRRAQERRPEPRLETPPDAVETPAVSYAKPSMFVLKKPSATGRPKEPGAVSLSAIMGLALADDGGLTHGIVQAVIDALTALW